MVPLTLYKRSVLTIVLVLMAGCSQPTQSLTPRTADAHLADAGEPDSGFADAGAAPCSSGWVERAISSEPGEARVPLEFVLADEDRLFLDVEVGDDASRVEVDLIDLASDVRRPFMSEPEGPVRMLDARGDRMMVVRAAPWNERIVAYIRGGVAEPYLDPSDWTIAPPPRSWIGDDFGVVHMFKGEGNSVSGKRSGEASLVRHGFLNVVAWGRLLAGRQLHFDGQTRIVIHPPSEFEPIFTWVVSNPPANDVEIGPWLVDDGVLWIEEGQILRWKLGDASPSPLVEETDCTVLDAKGTTVVLGCALDTAGAVPRYGALRVVVDDVAYDLREVEGTATEASVLSTGRVAWREWERGEDLCRGTLEAAGRLRVKDVVSGAPAEVVGRSGAPCLCCADQPPLRLEAEGNSVVWNYDVAGGVVRDGRPVIAASYDACRRAASP